MALCVVALIVLVDFVGVGRFDEIMVCPAPVWAEYSSPMPMVIFHRCDALKSPRLL